VTVALALACSADPFALENADGLSGSIAYVDYAAQVSVIDLPGGAHRWLTNSPSQKTSPRWSPDRQHIAFVGDSAGSYTLYVMDADGGHVTSLVAGEFMEAPSWSPDGSQLTFALLAYGKGIMIINTDGTGLKTLTEGRGPSWSPTGGFIAFEDSGAVVRINVDGSGRTRLTPLNGGADALSQDRAIGVSPDGQRIAFIRDSAATENLHVMNADGTGDRSLFDSAQILAWAPSGTMIAFLRIDGASWSGPIAAIHVIGADGTNERRISGLVPFGGMDWH
jgi:TolB protein